MARNIECKCEYNFTCRYCLANAKPWHYTLSNGSAVYVPRGWECKETKQ